jgi:hypothetical protein
LHLFAVDDWAKITVRQVTITCCGTKCHCIISYL